MREGITSSNSSQGEESLEGEADGNSGGGKKPRVVIGRKCSQCGDVSTSEWRTGPDGRGTLCNAYTLSPPPPSPRCVFFFVSLHLGVDCDIASL